MTESGPAGAHMRPVTVLAIVLPATLALIILYLATDVIGPVNAVFVLAPLILFHILLIFAFGLVLRESKDSLRGQELSPKLADLNQIRKQACPEDEHDLVTASDRPPESPQILCSKCGLDSLTLVGLLGQDLDLPEHERQRIHGRLSGSRRLAGFAKDLFMISGFTALIFAALSFITGTVTSLTQQLLISAGILIFLGLVVDNVLLPHLNTDHTTRLNEYIQELRSRG